MNDNELLVMLKQGNNKAFATLVERYKKRAYYLALRLVGNPDEAYDISQETFIRIYRSVRRFDTNKSFFSWFYTILSNLAKNHLKKRSVRQAYVSDVLQETNIKRATDYSDNPELQLEADEKKRQVWRAIEKLPFSFREIIILRHFEDCSYEEIAHLLKIPKGSVMSRLYYARLKLKQILEAEDG